MNVTVYTSPTCGYCHQVKAYLNQKGVQYVERDVSVDRAAADEMMKLTGQMGVPVIVINGQAIVGFNRPMLDKLLTNSGSRSNRPRFGIKIADASRMAQKAGLTAVFGAYVGQVAPGSPAHHAGLAPGDVITEINSRPVMDASDLEKVLASLTSGGTVPIVFNRGNNTMRTEVKV